MEFIGSAMYDMAFEARPGPALQYQSASGWDPITPPTLGLYSNRPTDHKTQQKRKEMESCINRVFNMVEAWAQWWLQVLGANRIELKTGPTLQDSGGLINKTWDEMGLRVWKKERDGEMIPYFKPRHEHHPLSNAIDFRIPQRHFIPFFFFF